MRGDYLLNAVVCSIIVALAFYAMWRAWQKRAQRGSELAYTPVAPSGQVLASYERVLYVVTHTAANKLERVCLPGLKYRGYAQLRVFSNGVEITVRGENPVFITGITAVEFGRNSLAKTVEKNGLTVLCWEGAGTPLCTLLRFDNAATQQEFTEIIGSRVQEGKNHPC